MTVKIFFCYAWEDEALLNKLKTHLRPLQRQGLIDVWHDRDISAGTEWEQEISRHLNAAQMILLLVSPDFMDSDYCYGIEMQRAIERHERDEARVVPVILRPTLWRETSLGKLQALPKDAKPVISWPNVDDALFSIAEGIRDIVIERRTAQEEQASKAREEPAQPLVTSTEAAAQEVEERSEEIPLNPSASTAQAPGEHFGNVQAFATALEKTSRPEPPLLLPEEFSTAKSSSISESIGIPASPLSVPNSAPSTAIADSDSLANTSLSMQGISTPSQPSAQVIPSPSRGVLVDYLFPSSTSQRINLLRNGLLIVGCGTCLFLLYTPLLAFLLLILR